MTRPDPASIEGALFPTTPKIVTEATRIIERDRGECAPVDVRVTWLGIRTALIAWYVRDGGELRSDSMVATDDDADRLHEAEGGTTSFPVMCRAEFETDEYIVVCALKREHRGLIKHDDLDGHRW